METAAVIGLGPVPAVRQALDRAGWKLGDVERIEINEAFAGIVVAVVRELGLSEDIVNVEGGAIAHGHPIGATGAILTIRIIHSMRRDAELLRCASAAARASRSRSRRSRKVVAAVQKARASKDERESHEGRRTLS